MTRINIVPPEELTDQHLFAEVREIRGVPRALARSLKKRGVPGVLAKVPADYTLGVGHMFFFFNKGFYLERRHLGLRMELLRRGITFDSSILFDPDGHYGTDAALQLDYTPTQEALDLIRKRIAERIIVKPEWYKRTTPRVLLSFEAWASKEDAGQPAPSQCLTLSAQECEYRKYIDRELA